MAVAITEEQLETEDVPKAAGSRGYGRWLWFSLGATLLFFSYGANNVPIAAWLAPALLLYFARNERWRVWVPLLFFVQAAAIAFQFRGMTLDSGIGYFLFLVIGAAQALAPYAADFWLAPRIGGIASTLVFPCTWTVLDYVNSFGSYGSWGTAAYSQSGDLPLLQLLSATGLWGVTFLIAWFASTCVYVWQRGWQARSARNAAYLCLATITTVTFLGGLRLTLLPPSSPTVRIASLSAREMGARPKGDFWERLIRNQAKQDELTAFRSWATAIDDDLLDRATREAESGAKVIFWAEGNADVLKADERSLVARGSALAISHRVYLGMALAVWNPDQAKPLENKFVLVQPDGEISWQYLKSHPVPGDEAGMSLAGKGSLPSVDTPFGRLSGAICFDADFPQLLAQAGVLGSDIVLVPSNDWHAIDPWHTQMAGFRAIEQGINLDRQTSHGLSAAFDYQGRVLAAMDHFHSSEYVMVADVPTRGVRTIYSQFGDWFAWLNAVGLLILAVLAFLPRRLAISEA